MRLAAPTTSSLNFEAGAINPNSVQVELPTSGADAGKIEISYDAFGQNGPTTDVLVDVVGYTLAAGSGGGDPALAARVAALEAANTAQAAAIAALQSDSGSMQWDIAVLKDFATVRGSLIETTTSSSPRLSRS